jgi:tryptophan synthase alpha chain
MSQRITQRFESLKSRGQKAFVTFVMAGDPTLSASADILSALPSSGADIIEIGMPFTDPMADGPAIQSAGLRALAHGTGLKEVLSLVQQFRRHNQDTPIILMGYFNPILAYNPQKFVQDAASAGADGLIIVDLPPEESNEIAPHARAAGLDMIRLMTPTTDNARLPHILSGASGFLYYVSIAGVTGTKSADVTAVATHIAHIKTQTRLPVVAGFGIKTPADVSAFSRIADGVVVGSAIVQYIEQHQKETNLADRVSAHVSTLKSAMSA